jgi:ATP-binding cassette subfamily B (MDR/TAP) protein 1
MGPGLAALNLGRSAAVDVIDTLERKPAINPSSKRGKRIENLRGAIQLNDLFFYYPSSPSRPLFHKLHLTIQPGQSIALVGPSGSGKSTIARFLLRFYDPNYGEIVIDDKYPLSSLDLSWWRSQIGYVAQEPIIFPGTIHENIAIGKPASEGPPSTKEVIEAAKLACAHDFILNLPNGYNTYYSGSSVMLSGGQMQRIAIARALIRNPKILVLDEATSALDQLSENHVLEALANIRTMTKVTTVTIAHRLTTIIDSDVIAVIANGNIAEIGDHKSLIQRENGIYRCLCDSQGIKPPHSGHCAVSHSENSAAASVPTSSTQQANDVAKKTIAEVAEEGLASSETEEKFVDIDADIATMSTIWRYVGWDVLYTLMGVIGSGMVGALSPCESILTAQIVTTL